MIPVIDNEKYKTRKGYECCLRNCITVDVVFHYDRGSRSGKVARKLLGNYVGLTQCDGYDVYEQFERVKGITLFGCWAYASGKFTEALDKNRALATQALCHIGKLYKVESEADEAGLSIEEPKEKCIRESYPVILEFERWIQDAYFKALLKSRTGKAIEYIFPLLPRLSRYVNDGRVNIDNNLIENEIRPLALGKEKLSVLWQRRIGIQNGHCILPYRNMLVCRSWP